MNNKKGFSLIELSIVLIIIGLLVAGITGGASLIKSAEMRSIMSEIRSYQTAINAYYTAIGRLPGTYRAKIDFSDSCNAWADLTNEGIIDVRLSMFSATNAGSGSYACLPPPSMLSSSNSIASKLKGGLYAVGYNNDMKDNVIFITADGETPSKLESAVAPDSNGTGGTPVSKPSITRKDAKFLDEKMDNGVIDSGKVYSFSSESGSCSYESDNESVKDCATAFAIGINI